MLAVCQWGCYVPKGVNTGRFTSEDVGSQKGVGLWNPTSVGEENKTFFARVWKPLPLPNRHFKNLRGKPKRESLKRTTANGMLVRTMYPKGGGYRAVYQRGCWVLKGWDCEISHWLERETSANEDVGSRKEVNYEIPHRLERETSFNEDAKPWKEVDCEMSRPFGRGTQHSLSIIYLLIFFFCLF